MAAPEPTKPQNESGQAAGPPSISLPKGGGAIRGIGEKFAANLVTGTGSMAVPIAASPGRSGFGPKTSAEFGFVSTEYVRRRRVARRGRSEWH
jgi:hypothetical protein